MKRHLPFCESNGKLTHALGVDPDRSAMLENEVNRMIEDNYNLRQIVETLNERGDMDDAEWTAFMFALGYWQGANGL